MEVGHPGGALAPAKCSDGTRVEVEVGLGTLLVANKTYFFMLNADGSTLTSFHAFWDAALVAVLTFEDGGMPGAIASDVSLTPGHWISENPPDAYISTTSTDGSNGGATVSGMTITVAGGTSGGAIMNIGSIGTRRGRLKVAVGATGGYLAVAPTGKAG